MPVCASGVITTTVCTAALVCGSVKVAALSVFRPSAGFASHAQSLGSRHITVSRIHMSSNSAPLRVVTYNVLSSHLAAPDHFTDCDPKNLDADTRLKRVKAKLQEEVGRGAVICLQEISTTWAGPLHAFLARQGYHMVTGLYGKPFNGYMGVGLAWPTAKFEALDVDITRVADTKKWGRQPAPGLLTRAKDWVLRVVRGLGILGQPPRVYDPWTESKWRSNQMVSARLRETGEGGRTVCIGTYHMPCFFMCPAVMVIHAALSVQHIKKLAGGNPHILAGDFNWTPGSACDRLVTEGRLESTAPEYPQPTAWEKDWQPTVPEAMKSAYRDVLGKEPDFTNHAKTARGGAFIDTLDYIYYSAGLQPTAVLPLKHRDEVQGPFPTETEPSDHVMIAADFKWQSSGSAM